MYLHFFYTIYSKKTDNKMTIYSQRQIWENGETKDFMGDKGIARWYN